MGVSFTFSQFPPRNTTASREFSPRGRFRAGFARLFFVVRPSRLPGQARRLHHKKLVLGR